MSTANSTRASALLVHDGYIGAAISTLSTRILMMVHITLAPEWSILAVEQLLLPKAMRIAKLCYDIQACRSSCL